MAAAALSDAAATVPSVTELDLYEVPIGEPGFATDPSRYMEDARRRHPWLGRCAFGCVVTEYRAVNDLLMMEERVAVPAEQIVGIMGGEGTEWARFQVENLQARSGDVHRRIRSSVAKAFMPAAVASYRARIRDVVAELLDEWAPKGAFDFADFASNFPVAVMFGVLGASGEHIPRIKPVLETVGLSFSLDRALFAEIDAAFDKLWGFIGDFIDARRERPSAQPDLLDALIEAEDSGQITHLELCDLLVFLFVAGYDTSKNQLSQIMLLMLDRPEPWRRCADERDYCDRVVEEALRHSAVATTYREVTQDIVYRDVRIPAGTMLIFPLSIIGRDPDVFPDPLAFAPERPNARRHLAFSRGAHICLGQFLAKAQIAEGIHQMAQRITAPRLVGEVTWRPFPGIWGPGSLPIAFTPAPARTG